MTGHAGEFPNCRCYTEPVIPRIDGTARPFFTGLATQAEEKASGEKRLTSAWERMIGSEAIPHVPGEPSYNVNNAYFEPKKLTGYSLNFDGEKGKHKARVWEATIGATKKDAACIRKQVMACQK